MSSTPVDQSTRTTQNSAITLLHDKLGCRYSSEIDHEIVALGRQLAWTHFQRIVYLDDPLERDFYAEMCWIERWGLVVLPK